MLEFVVMRVFYLILIASLLTPALAAQSRNEAISCYAERGAENRAYKKKLWEGYEISLGPVRNAEEKLDDNYCTAAIYSLEGKVVYRTTGINVVFDEDDTGEDIDGDGHKEVVFKTDTGGGNHCCWVYNVISLWPRPHKLIDVAEDGATDFRKDGNGKIEIWEMERGPFYGSEADTPYAQKVYRVRSGKLIDITPQRCGEILGTSSPDELSPARLKRFKANEKASLTSQPGFEMYETEGALIALALQHTFCRQFEKALGDFQLWPESKREATEANFAEAIQKDYPEFAARLTSKPKQ